MDGDCKIQGVSEYLILLQGAVRILFMNQFQCSVYQTEDDIIKVCMLRNYGKTLMSSWFQLKTCCLPKISSKGWKCVCILCQKRLYYV